MRVTSGLLMENFLRDLGLVQQRLAELQHQTATGRKFTRPQDAPAAVATSMNLDSVLAFLNQYNRNIEDGTSRLSFTETALSDANQHVQRVRELTVQGSSTYLTRNDRGALALEINQLLESVTALGNSNFRGNYIFSGWETLTKTFSFNYQTGSPHMSSVTFRGDTGRIDRNIQVGQDLEVNLNGKDVFLQKTYTLTSKQLGGGELGLAGTIVINGRSFLIGATDTLTSIRDRINADPAAEVYASIDRNFVLKLESLNSSEPIELLDQSGTVLQDMGILPQGAFNLARTGPALPLVDSTGAIHVGAALGTPLTINASNNTLVVRLGPNANQGANESKAIKLTRQTYNTVAELAAELQARIDGAFGENKVVVSDGGGFLRLETFVQNSSVSAADFQIGGLSDLGEADTASVVLGLTAAGGPDLADFAGTDGNDRFIIDLGPSAWRGGEPYDPSAVELNIDATVAVNIDGLVQSINDQIDRSPELTGLVRARNDGGRLRLETYKEGIDVLGADLAVSDAAPGTLASLGLSSTPLPAYIQGTVSFPPGVVIAAGVNDQFTIDLGPGSSLDGTNPPPQTITLTPGVYATIVSITNELNNQISLNNVLRGTVQALDDGFGNIILQTTAVGSRVQADDLVLADVAAGTLAGLGLAGPTVPGAGSSDGQGQIELPDNIVDTMIRIRDALLGRADRDSKLVDLLDAAGNPLGLFPGSKIAVAAGGATSEFIVRRFTTCEELADELERRLGAGVEARIGADGSFYLYNTTTATVTGVSVTAEDPAGNPVEAFNLAFAGVSGNLVPQGEMRSLSLGEDERFIGLHNRLANVDTGMENILSCMAQVGSRYNRLERTQTQNEAIIQNLTELKASNDDVDMARIITELKTLENVLNASLGVGAKLLPPSLFDYLR